MCTNIYIYIYIYTLYCIHIYIYIYIYTYVYIYIYIYTYIELLIQNMDEGWYRDRLQNNYVYVIINIIICTIRLHVLCITGLLTIIWYYTMDTLSWDTLLSRYYRIRYYGYFIYIHIRVLIPVCITIIYFMILHIYVYIYIYICTCII